MWTTRRRSNRSATSRPTPAFPIRISPALLRAISGDDLAIPDLRTRDRPRDRRAGGGAVPAARQRRRLGVRFGRELNASDDRGVRRSAPSARAARGIAADRRGKHIEPFRVALDAVRYSITRADARRLLRSGRHEHPRLAYRDVASATNRLTLIAAVLPAHCVSTHTLFCLRTPLRPGPQHLLCGLFNSFVVNYLVRLRVTTHVTTATVERLPIPTNDAAPAACREIAGLARLLARRRDPAALARLNARVAELYQLTAAEFAHVLTTFPLIPARRARRRPAGVHATRRGDETERHTELRSSRASAAIVTGSRRTNRVGSASREWPQTGARSGAEAI